MSDNIRPDNLVNTSGPIPESKVPESKVPETLNPAPDVLTPVQDSGITTPEIVVPEAKVPEVPLPVPEVLTPVQDSKIKVPEVPEVNQSPLVVQNPIVQNPLVPELPMQMHMVMESNELISHPISAELINENMVRRMVQRGEHPHPMVILFIVSIIILLLYYIYAMFIKISFDGSWIVDGREVLVYHNKWNDAITINDWIHGYVKGNTIYLDFGDELRVGLLYGRSIRWIDSEVVWYRPSIVA